MHACAHMHTYTKAAHMCIHRHTYAYMYTHISTCTCFHTYTGSCVHASKYTHRHTYTQGDKRQLFIVESAALFFDYLKSCQRLGRGLSGYECLLCKHEDQHFSPQHPHQKPDMAECASNPGIERWKQHWLASLAEMVSLAQ